MIPDAILGYSNIIIFFYFPTGYNPIKGDESNLQLTMRPMEVGVNECLMNGECHTPHCSIS